MSRKKKPDAAGENNSAAAVAPIDDGVTGPATISTAGTEAMVSGAEPDAAWATPYKSILTSNAAGIELGEDRRFKQRVLKFRERPDETVLATLKANGFTYRAAEKAWTLPANAESRALTDRLVTELIRDLTGKSPEEAPRAR